MEKNYSKNFRKIIINDEMFIVFKEKDNMLHYFTERSMLVCSYINGQIIGANINGSTDYINSIVELVSIDFEEMKKLNKLTKTQFHHMIFKTNAMPKEYYGIFTLFPVCIISLILTMIISIIGIEKGNVLNGIPLIPLVLVYVNTKINRIFFNFASTIIEKISPKIKKLMSVK